MLNDREDKYENPEESEYHFSDDDVNYEVDSEAPKPVVVPEQKESFLTRLSRSRRMLIVGVVFLVLVFVVYKLVAPPASVAPSTEITPSVATTRVMTRPINPQVATNVVTTTQNMPSATVNVATSAPAQRQAPMQPPPIVTANPPTVALPTPVQQATSTTTQTVTQPTVTSGQMIQPISASSTPTTMPTPTTTPAVTPSQPIVSSQIPSQVPVNQMASNVVATPTVSGTSVDAGIASMAATNEKLIAQLQAEYSQKLNDYASQTKVMQDQLQTLNTRVASMESQLNQLIQTLNRQNQPQPALTPTMVTVPPAQVQQQPPAPPPQAQPAVPEHFGYTVQAIIPGRAWLRSDNGETVTVAEGDVIKGAGRVTKIDPYDGIVEINIGTRTISLSYGNGG